MHHGWRRSGGGSDTTIVMQAPAASNASGLLPQGAGSGVPAPERVPPAADVSGPSILLVEDDAVVRDICAVTLARAGHVVDTAADGALGWDALNTRSYDLLITDNNMPKMSGVELLKRVRSAQMFLPVILTSGDVFREDLRTCPSESPLSILLAKPFSPGELLAVVRRALDLPSEQQPVEGS